MNYALITGGSSGIGREYARELAAQGWNLIIVSNRKEDNVRVAEELSRQYGVAAEPLYADLTEADAAEKIYDYVQRLGVEVEVLIYIAQNEMLKNAKRKIVFLQTLRG